ncbi:hypothetical protein ACFO3K_13310 [Cellulomonas algicola]|uniref:hypothetical protein n=1 Tax=Cellulomonas algicola TaxID=2071633 RepID=UPI001C3F8F9D|nr:hypothetical protein [Cellulomonas algicola]
MSWAVVARRVRDPHVPLPYRLSALRSLVNRHHPLGFGGTQQHLGDLVGTSRPPGPGWTGDDVLAALDVLEESRASRLRYVEAFAERRRQEKAEHRRQPTRADVDALRRAEWVKDVDEASVRHASVRERRRTSR